MEDLRNHPLDVRLSALLDREIDDKEREELERLIATDDDARALYERLKHGSDVGRKAFNDMLKEPVPLALVRSIRNAQPPKEPSRLARFSPPKIDLVPTGKQALAASILLFFLGGGIGYLIGINPAAPPPPLEADPHGSTWLDEIAAYHRVYARQQRHLVEVPASEADHIVKWLTNSVGVGFKLPDLSASGLEFQGARLLVAGGKPVGQLIYKSMDGDIVAICFQRDAAPSAQESDRFEEVIRDDLGMVTWHGSQAYYVLVGPSAEANLPGLARQASADI
ncbi:anti-sigma factor [Rhizobiaceae bacterium n13]|uniref:Anti-sigma factor n=1 Tax=Ferirhizobium litorale TaxID=2927786 RepID=A0AAE3QCS3_9HYPH|nr:anti-sigma factor [Fererhizobium litorale]MDI7860843.1 anti-sigma factor [Fererhizobium litorale]MDI7920991.1 anti-sigma factor [Fererhizobium litorale]